MKKISLILSLFLFSFYSIAQTSLMGKVTDEETGEELFGANIVVLNNGVFTVGGSTDLDGNYKVDLDPGTYDVECSYIGLPTKKITDVLIKAGQANKLDVGLGGQRGISLDEVVVTEYKVPLIEQDNTTSGSVLTYGNNYNNSRSYAPRKKRKKKKSKRKKAKAKSGDQVTIQGSRSNGTDYYIDGIRVSGAAALIPQSELQQNNQFHMSGTPAKQGEKQEDKAVQKEAVVASPEKKLVPKVENIQPIREPISNQEEYEPIIENSFVQPVDEAFSTFSIDVDRAAYSIVRRYIDNGMRPNPHAARTEEMINYFNYDYPKPNREVPFSIYTELGECPWNKNHQILHVGLQGEQMDFNETPGANLVFLIDVSGSMGGQHRLGLVKKAFKLLIDQLRAEDRVAIVVYAGAAGLVLPPTSAANKSKIKTAINNLQSGGSTAGGAGIELAYKVAKENFIKGGNNRVILATDGDFNVGVSSRDGLEKLIDQKRKDGIFLTAIGVGMGNYKDNRLETLADKGNGNYAYMDDMREAKRVFMEEITGTLYTIAKDVKIQMIFDSTLVKSYRLIGYENRMLEKKDFDDDTKDAGELGAGHTVTALYEIIPTATAMLHNEFIHKPVVDASRGPSGMELQADAPSIALATIRLRYKAPDKADSRLIEQAVNPRPFKLKATSDNFRFSAAVASFSLLLRNSKYKGDTSCKSILKLADGGKGKDHSGYRKEFIELVEDFQSLEMVTIK